MPSDIPSPHLGRTVRLSAESDVAADRDRLAVELEGLAAAVDEAVADPAVALGFRGVRVDVARAERGGPFPLWDALELGVAENLAEDLVPAVRAIARLRPQHDTARGLADPMSMIQHDSA